MLLSKTSEYCEVYVYKENRVCLDSLATLCDLSLDMPDEMWTESLEDSLLKQTFNYVVFRVILPLFTSWAIY